MNRTNEDTGKRPRYLQVRDRLVERIQSGVWAPGQAIPSEVAIAREFQVSQGTARTAVAALASENVVVRRQGLGTFVYEHTPEDELTRFFCLFDGRHDRIGADARHGRPSRATANRAERRELRLATGSKVLRIGRVRARNGTAFALERISLPEVIFPGLAGRAKLPNALYEMYQKSYGVLVVRVEERITAAAADASTADALGVSIGVPLLRVERVALALDDKPVEWRVSHCHLADAHYLVRLR